MIPPEILGTIPGWITSASMVTILGLILRHRTALKTLADARDADIRSHYADELQRVIQRQHECEERETALRERVQTLEDEVTGLKRQIIRYSAETVAFLEGRNCPSDKAPQSVASAERVIRHVEGK